MTQLTPEITNKVTNDIVTLRFDTVIYNWQRFARIMMKPVMSAFAQNITFNFDEHNLQPEKTYVVVSNHQSQLDAFILLASFSPALFTRFEPFRR